MEFFLTRFIENADRFLIFFYRTADNPIVGYSIGTAVLALFCMVFGELLVSAGIRINKNHIDQLNREAADKEKLSIKAYGIGDRLAYRALNKQATDAWGKQFFTMAAHSFGKLCPIPFALGWMQTRFIEVEFDLPLTIMFFGDSVGYAFTFILFYILLYILYGNAKSKFFGFVGMRGDSETEYGR